MTVIKGRKVLAGDRRSKLEDVYRRCFIKALRDENHLKVAFYGIKWLPCLTTDEKSHETLTGVLPIEKSYDGKRYGVKDYFSTVETLNGHGLDIPFGDSVSEILWDYHNWDMGHDRVLRKLHDDDKRHGSFTRA